MPKVSEHLPQADPLLRVLRVARVEDPAEIRKKQYMQDRTCQSSSSHLPPYNNLDNGRHPLATIGNIGPPL
ncbi:hypothetical protein PG994_005505 [Apiospora phragmitis]|uniref:Uncharacterized protein n=1 Tax=Apiospora phragmitis TaxID=2905665 RepID=A0ABR1VCF2_9PEZI